MIAILAVIALVSYNGIQNRAEETKLKSTLSQARTQLEGKKIETGEYAVDLAQAQDEGLSSSKGVKLEYTGLGENYCLSATSERAKKSFHVTGLSGAVIEDLCQGHKGVEPSSPTTAASCFKVWHNTIDDYNVISSYYDNEDNDSSKPACPRDVTIPSSINGVRVTEIGFQAFKGKRLVSVTIPDSIVTIDNHSFMDNRFSSVYIPDSVKKIGSQAFRDSGIYLKTASIPSGLNYVHYTEEDAAIDPSHVVWQNSFNSSVEITVR